MSTLGQRARRVCQGFRTAHSKHRFVISKLAMLSGVDVPWASFETADGSRLRLHADYIPLGLWQETYADRLSIQVCTDLLRPGDIAVDVGANIGHFTVAMGNAVGRNGRILSVEPNPRTNRHLRENVRLNQLGNVTIECVAIGRADDDDACFYVPRRCSGEGALGTKPKFAHYDKFQVVCRTGERLLENQGLLGQPLSLMKVDVEGYEVEVLEGFGATLSQFDCILFEYSVDNIRDAGHSPGEVLDLLGRFGYHVYACDPDARGVRPPRPDETMADLVAVRDATSFCARTGYRIEE